jgi:hypothetical protein
MIFDTGSDWLWVNSRICENCNDRFSKYDERKSSTFSLYPVLFDLHYGSGDVYGFLSHDTICVKEDKCASDFSLMVVAMQRNMKNIRASGIVGLSPKNVNSRSDLFIQKLKQSGVIESAVFSMFIELQNETSKMTLGGYDIENYAARNASLEFHNISNSSFHWEIQLDMMGLVHS